MPSSPQRRNNDVPVLYQIDFTAVAAGKRVASSKRRIRWYVVLYHVHLILAFIIEIFILIFLY